MGKPDFEYDMTPGKVVDLLLSRGHRDIRYSAPKLTGSMAVFRDRYVEFFADGEATPKGWLYMGTGTYHGNFKAGDYAANQQ